MPPSGSSRAPSPRVRPAPGPDAARAGPGAAAYDPAMTQSLPTVRPLQGPPPPTMPVMYSMEDLGYVEHEYLVEGQADSYQFVSDRHPHGRWDIEPTGDTARFCTRIVVRRPVDPAAFSGTVLVEWNNVSGGIDASPDWAFLHRHLVRRGDAWVGVTAQKVGVDGGGMYGGFHLKSLDPDRYAELEHPGDAYCFDLFTQVGRALRDSSADGALGGLAAQRLLAAGESQSAMRLVTYINGVDPLVEVYDGFFVHGRPAMAADLDDMELIRENMDLSERFADFPDEGEHIRHDARVPVMVLQSETDVTLLRGHLARPDVGGQVRLWEVTGTAHADTYLLSASGFDDGKQTPEHLADVLKPFTEYMGFMTFEQPINAGPHQHYVGQAAYEWLDRWAAGGPPPPTAPLLHVDVSGGDLERDDLGIALGGLRTPWVDEPIMVLSGLGQSGEQFAVIFGTTRVLDAAALAERYPGGRDDYVAAFTAGIDQAIEAGYLLAEDRDEILAVAAATYDLEVDAGADA